MNIPNAAPVPMAMRHSVSADMARAPKDFPGILTLHGFQYGAMRQFNVGYVRHSLGSLGSISSMGSSG